MNILVLGSTGLLGSTISPFLNSHNYEVSTHSRCNRSQYHADMCDVGAVNRLLSKVRPDVILNLVGLTDVEICEQYPNQAYILNVRTLEYVTSWIRREKPSCHLIHISSDQVYDGSSLHTEELVTLTNYYAFSKYAGELVATTVPSTILRTNFFGRSECAQRVSLSDWLYNAISNNVQIQVFDDILFSPLAMSTLSELILCSIRKKPIGVFNLGSHEGLSKADFAFAFAECMGLSTSNIKRITSDQVKFIKTYRPKDMRMNSAKFEDALEIRLPSLADEIRRVTREYHENA